MLSSVVCQRRDGKLKVKGRFKNIVTLFLLMFHLAKNASNLVRKRKGGWPMVTITSAVTATALVDCIHAYITLNYLMHLQNTSKKKDVSYWSRQRQNIPATNVEDRWSMKLDCVIQLIVKKAGNAQATLHCKQNLDYIWLSHWQIFRRMLLLLDLFLKETKNCAAGYKATGYRSRMRVGRGHIEGH